MTTTTTKKTTTKNTSKSKTGAAKKPAAKKAAITKATTKKPETQEATLSASSVVVVAGEPRLVSRQNLVKLIPKAGITVSALVKKAVDAEINPRGETTPEFVQKHIEGAFKARKIALK